MLDWMPDAAVLADFLQLCAVLAALFGAGKVLFAIARFFIELSNSVKTLTRTFEKFTQRFDAHAALVTADIADVRERTVALESWRQTTEAA